jgi:hypothetical protein
MSGVVLPSVAGTSTSGKSGCTVATANLAPIATAGYGIRGTIPPADIISVAATDVVAVTSVDVRVAIEVVVAVDVDSIVAAPTATPPPTSAPERPHGDANAERDCHPCGVVPRWRIVNGRVRVKWRTVHIHGIVRRHVNHLRICLLNHDHAVAFDNFGLHLLLLARLQIAFILSFLPHPLDGFHYIALLRQERVTQISGPLNVIGQPLYYIRESRQGLDTWIPGLFLHRIRERFVL